MPIQETSPDREQDSGVNEIHKCHRGIIKRAADEYRRLYYTGYPVLSRDRQTAPDLHKTLYFRRKRDRLTERSDIQHQTNG